MLKVKRRQPFRRFSMLVLRQVRLSSCYPFSSSLQLSFGSRHSYGLMGPNGAGKTTLLRLFAGDIQPESGVVDCHVSRAFVPQEARWSHDLTMDAFISQTPQMAFELSASEWRERLGLHAHPSGQLMTELSGGERTLWALWQAIMKEPGILLLDEPSNHLDEAACERVVQVIQQLPCVCIVTSHDPRILVVLEELLDLQPQGIRIYGDGYHSYVQEMEQERLAKERSLVDATKSRARAKEKAREALSRQEQRQRQGRTQALKSGVGKMARGIMQRRGEATAGRVRDTHEDRVATAEKQWREAREQVHEIETIRLDWLGERKFHGRPLVLLRDVNHAFGEKNLWSQPLYIDIVGGEKTLIKGPNGSGKSTLLRILLGELIPGEGSIQRQSVRAAMLSQDPRLTESPNESVLALFQRRHPHVSMREIRAWLARFLFTGDEQLKEWSVLSGGEKMRCGLADVFMHQPGLELLLLDEPTNHLDQKQIDPLLQFLQDLPISIVMVTHDERLMNAVTFDKTICLTRW